MSLILEALKKLERDKQAGDRGFLVMAAAPWPSTRRGTTAWIALGVALLVILVGAGAWFLRGRMPGPASAPIAAAPPAAPTIVPSAPPAPEVTAAPPTSLPTAPPLDTAPPPTTASAVTSETPADATEAPVPTRPPTPLPPYRLSAISEQDGKPVAVLNDRVVSEGDAFDGIKVLRIGESEVEIEVAGERRTVRF